MNPPDLTDIANLYSASLEKNGSTPRGVGWRDEGSQYLRFEKLSRVIDDRTPFTVNELGCGYGAMFEYFRDSGLPLGGFRGHEIARPMFDVARTRIGASPIVTLSDSPKLDQPADFSFASGIFNVRLEFDEATWTAYVEDTLANLSEFSRRGFAFNVLSTYVDYREPHLFYADPMRFFDLCKRKLGRYVSLSHDYPLYEWTMTVRK